MTRLDGKKILETCFLRAAEVAHGTSNFVDSAGARAMSVAEVACLVGLFAPM